MVFALKLRNIEKGTKHFVSTFFKRKCCQRLDRLAPEVEACLNEQVNHELYASYSYFAMACFFGRQNISLRGCQKFFMLQVEEEQTHGRKFAEFISSRGGCVTLRAINSPPNQEWASPICAFKESLDYEVDITQKLLALHRISDEFNDAWTCNFLEDQFLEEQRDSIDKFARYMTLLERMGTNGLGVQIFDQQLLQECGS